METRRLATLLLLMFGLSASGARRQTTGSTATQPVSPVAVASWATRNEALDLLVILRGTPGWWTSGYGPDSSSLGEHGFSIQARYGGRDLELVFDGTTRVATIQGVKVTVGTNNIVLADEVDSPAGIKIAGLEKVAPLMESRHIDSVIRRSTKAVEFLRCDVKLSEAKFDVIASRLCDAIRRVKQERARF